MNCVRCFFSKVGIDSAIIYVILGRGLSVISGVITILLISKFMTAEHQGYYFTFSSVIALQVFFELGLGTILVQFASHEMGKLKFKKGVLEGDLISRYRLLSLIRLTLKWYSFVAFFILSVVLVAGFYFFNESLTSATNVVFVNWKYPWVLLIILTSISMYFIPIIAIAEGCGLVSSANKMRIKQVIISSFIMWSCIITGNGLYATSAMAFSIIVVGGLWLYKNFMSIIIESFYVKNKIHRISWVKEIFPMQWKIALSWISGYFIFQFLTPLAFKRYGVVFAGQLGLSLTICTLMLNLSMAWINTKIPYWGRLISQNKHEELNASYGLSFKYSCFFFILMMVTANIILFLLRFLGVELVSRVLSINSFFFLCLCMLGHHIVSCQATYVRSHKIELYTKLSVVTAFTVFLTIYSVSTLLPYEFIMPVYFTVTWGLFVPWSTFVFLKFRQSKITHH